MIESLLRMPTRGGVRNVVISATQATIAFGALVLAVLGLVLPTHDYASLGDPVLGRLVLRDALAFATVVSSVALTLSVISVVQFRKSWLVWPAGLLTLLSIINLWRCVSYYWLHPEWIGH